MTLMAIPVIAKRSRRSEYPAAVTGTTACGLTERKCPATTEARVANRPGPTPPIQALAATARTNKVRGTSVPRIG
jgi:hypothetical protein